MAAEPFRLRLYGSCVSRDMIEHLDGDYTLLKYTARQSLISAMAPPLPKPDGIELDSAFQRRMVRDDLVSSIARSLVRRANQIDLLVVDLVDERLGVVALPGGHYLTRSQELLDSGLLDEYPGSSGMIAFGTDEHFALWQPAAIRFLQLLRQTGLFERTLLIEATFASRTDTGEAARQWWRKPARHWNRAFSRYYDVLKGAGIRTHVIGPDAVAGATHKWGPAAYHYTETVYRQITTSIEQIRRERAAP